MPLSSAARAVCLLTAACVNSGTVRGPAVEDSESGPVDDRELVEVEHHRELRGVWIATVANINFPSRQGLSADDQQAELTALADLAASVGLNALFFQVRPEGDALYRSDLEPWSRFLTGTQGQDPGYDPLSFLVDAAHRRGLEVHAWLNPYRAKSARSAVAVAPHISVTDPDHVVTYGDLEWMDPGSTVVQDRTAAVVADIVRRYDIDGIHLDDYFYPYPNGSEFPDDATWQAYLAAGGTMSRSDWRRDNVNRMVERLATDIVAIRPEVRFGISPFGIYRPGIPEGISGLDQYEAIYSDPPLWLEQGWVDYLAPQLYWPSTKAAQAFEPLVDWWSALVDGDGRSVFTGHYLSKLGSSAAWSIDEIRTQVALCRGNTGCRGQIWFQIEPLQANRLGVSEVFRDELYATPALTPVVAGLGDPVFDPPSVAVLERQLTLSHPQTVRQWVVYRSGTGGWDLDRIVPGPESLVDVAPGQWAVSAVGRYGVESLGVVVEVE